MYDDSQQPAWYRSQLSSTLIAGALLTGGLATFLVTTAAAAHPAPTPAPLASPLAVSSSRKPSPLVPMSRDDAHRPTHADRASNRVTEPNPLPSVAVTR